MSELSQFARVKEKLLLKDVIEFYMNESTSQCGSDTYEMETKECPSCGHKNCFKIHEVGGPDSYYKCFSCDVSGDAISFVQEFLELPNASEAANRLCSDFKLGDLKIVSKKSTMTDIEKVLEDASLYYAQCLLESEFSIDVDGTSLSPLEYQLQVRKHSKGMLETLRIGYSDGKLHEYLLSIGHSVPTLLSSGLVMKDSRGILYDFFTKGLFIYPHFTRSRVSYFSQKDPTKTTSYQFPAKFRLNNCLFYGQETVIDAQEVFVVEGQNDRISLLEAGFKGAVLATCGHISSKQLDWMKEQLEGKTLLTCFDSDQAGDLYRLKVSQVLPKCSHIKFPLEVCKDVDDFLKKVSPNLSEVFAYVDRSKETAKGKPAMAKVETSIYKKEDRVSDVPDPETHSVSVPKYDKDVGIVEKSGAYFLLKTDKDGNDKLVRLTDFVIRLKNIFVADGKRIRQAEVIRCDCKSGQPILVDSETKVSVKHFRSKVADSCDASFFGGEQDLINMWRYIYKNSVEKTVYLPDHVGKIEEEGGWLFGNVYIKHDGEVIKPDKTGVMWINGNLTGVRPVPISEDMELDIQTQGGSRSIPRLNVDRLNLEVDQIERTFVLNYAKNLGPSQLGNALLILGWAKMNAFSDRLFQAYGFTPFLFLWGDKGVGKTSLIQWILGLYSMRNHGYDTLANLRSGVGFERKLGYYSSLPVCLDELRASKEMIEFTGRFRAWYNRSGRSMAGQGSKKIIQQQVRSNFIFGGQDMFNDDALRERCVVIRLPKEGRELKESYSCIYSLEASESLSCIGFKWILESQQCNYESILRDIENITANLLERGCRQRTARVWACLAYFAKGLSKIYFPDYDFDSFLYKACGQDVLAQSDNSFLNKFFELVEGIYYMAQSPISFEQIRLEGEYLYFWFVDIWRICQRERKDYTEEHFSREAIRTALREEPYFVEEDTKRMGQLNKSAHRVMVFKVSEQSVPEPLKSIAESLSDRQ